MRAEDMLPAGVDAVERDGVTIRKGSIGAFVANIRALRETGMAAADREQILADMRDLVPALQAVGLFDAFDARDPEVRALIRDTLSA